MREGLIFISPFLPFLPPSCIIAHNPQSNMIWFYFVNLNYFPSFPILCGGSRDRDLIYLIVAQWTSVWNIAGLKNTRQMKSGRKRCIMGALSLQDFYQKTMTFMLYVKSALQSAIFCKLLTRSCKVQSRDHGLKLPKPWANINVFFCWISI